MGSGRSHFSIGSHELGAGAFKKTNLLVIGLLYKGVCIPLVWQDLNRAGNSSSAERLALVDRFLAWWGKTGLPLPTLYLVGDREFIGQHWLMGLERRQIHYVMRLKRNRTFEVWQRYSKGKRKVRLSVLQRWLQRTGRAYAEIVLADELIAPVVMLPLDQPSGKEGNYLYLITNRDCPDEVQTLYRIRWQIEVCFKHLKTNGFHLEDLNRTQPHKIELMFGVLTLTYALAVREGILTYTDQEQAVPVKQYANGQQTLAKSVFRKGLTQLKRKVRDVASLWAYLKTALAQATNQRKLLKTSTCVEPKEKLINKKSINFLC